MRAPFAAAAVAVCALLAPAVLAVPNCAWNGYDLSPVANDHTSATTSGVLYRGVICGTSVDTRCTTYKSTASVCQYTASPPTVTGSLATWDGTGVWSQISDDQPALGVQVAFTNGQSTSCATGMTTTFKFPCGPLTTMSVQSTGACNFVVTLQNPAACNGGTTGGGGDGGSKGLSGGSIFLIIFFVVVPVYVVAGCVYKRKQMGASGMESCPNIDFWRTLPGLVGDGFKFTWAKLRGLCGGGGGGGGGAGGNASYDTL